MGKYTLWALPMNIVPKNCPSCGLALFFGAIMDAASERERYGPILGLDRDADAMTATAGYIGISSMWLYDVAPEFYKCPRCGIDPIASRLGQD